MNISIILAVYNGEDSISKAIESILAQTYSNFEFLIIDDGSEDNTLEIVENYAKEDKRIQIIKNKKNIGLTKSLNKAIRASKCEFIARQDVDDISLPQRLEKQINFLKENPNYAFCGTDGVIKQNNLSLIKYFEFSDVLRNLIIENCFTHTTITIRRDILEKYGFYDEKYLYGQDYELWCRLIYKYGLKAKNLRDRLVIESINLEKLRYKNYSKFFIQRRNFIKTKLKYLRFSKRKFKGLLSILFNIMEVVYLRIYSLKR